jgi:hypothetical protein
MQKSFAILFIFLTILMLSTISSASATSGWVQSIHPPNVRHTALNPGNIKICGNHICAPFENLNKLSQVTQNHESFFVKQNTSTITKTLTKITSQTLFPIDTK